MTYVGLAKWTGASAAGLTGEFEGWISDDSAAIPILAEVKIALGSIWIELESWTRPGWSPPTGWTPLTKK
jgi:proteasome assembly chaperone (PAC2) family protein